MVNLVEIVALRGSQEGFFSSELLKVYSFLFAVRGLFYSHGIVENEPLKTQKMGVCEGEEKRVFVLQDLL